MVNKLKSTFSKIPQLVFLTISFFFKNNLDACASACAFSFIFSFFPILVLVLTLFVRFLHVSPAMISDLSVVLSEVTPYVDVHKIMDALPDGFVLTWGNLFLLLFVIWMARKLFLSIIKGLLQIFNSVAPSRPVINQLLTFLGELVIVILCALSFFAAFITRQIFTMPVFAVISERFPVLFSTFSNRLVNWTLFAILFLSTTLSYRFGSGTKPKLRNCLFCSLLATVVFTFVVYLISNFMDHSNYNTLYGVLGKIIILLFEVYIFFVLFMIFAQLLYSIQFFDTLVLGELYTLPEWESGIISSLRHKLFNTPITLMTKENTFTVAAGKTIFSEHEEVDCVYYISFGSVCESRGELKTLHYKGSFFGEFEFMLNMNRLGSAVALTDCRLIKIKKEDFAALIEKNQAATSKAMSTLSSYSAKFYGRNSSILI